MVDTIKFNAGNEIMFNASNEIAFACPDTPADVLCDIQASDDIDVFFDDIINCADSGDCAGCDLAGIFNGNTFQCNWNVLASAWVYYNAGTNTLISVGIGCPAGTLTISAASHSSCDVEQRNCAFLTTAQAATSSPPTVTNEYAVGDCDTVCDGPDVCGYDGYATVVKH